MLAGYSPDPCIVADVRRYLRPLLVIAATFGALVGASAVLILLVEIRIPLDDYREQLAGAAAHALNAEVHIEGPLNFFTGLRAGVEVERLRIAGKTAAGRWSADVNRARLRLRPLALLSHELRIAEAILEEATWCASADGGTKAAPPASQPRPKSAWRLAAIERVNIAHASIVTSEPCTLDHRIVEIASLEAAPEGENLRIVTQGTFKDQAWRAELNGPLLALLNDAARPAAFEFTGEFAGARLQAAGTATLKPLLAEADVTFEAGQLATVLSLTNAPLKDFGPLSVRAHIRADAIRQTVRIDEAKLAPVVATGEFALDRSGPRPRLTVSARSENLDVVALQAWLAQSLDYPRLVPGKMMKAIMAGARASEGELTIDIGRLAAGATALDALGVAGSWREGKARAKVAARLGKRPLDATFDADMRGEALKLTAQVLGSDLQVPNTAIRIGKAQARVSALGEPGDALRRSLRGELVVQGAKIEMPLRDGATTALTVDLARVEWQARETLRFVFAGTAFNQRLSFRLEGADAGKLLQGDPWPLRTTTAFGPLHIESAGNVTLREPHSLAQLDFTASAQSLGSLVGHKQPLANLPAAARGQWTIAEDDWRVDLKSVRLGNTRGRALVTGALSGPRPLQAEISFDVLDVAELIPPPSGKDPFERQLLPRVALPDADLAVNATRLLLRGGKSMQVQLSARTRAGRLEQAPFSLMLNGANLKGTLAADLQPAEAKVSATLEASGLDARRLDARLASTGVRLTIGSAKLTATATGNRLRDLAASAVLNAEAREVDIGIEERGARRAFTGSLGTASLSVAAGQPPKFAASGALMGQPLSLEASTAPLSVLLSARDIPFDVSGRLADADVTLRGHRNRNAMQIDLRVAAGRVDTFNALFGTDLPPVGPLALDLAVQSAGKRALSANAKVALGESRIAVKASSRDDGGRVNIDVELNAPILRLEDLGSAYWVKDRDQAKGQAEGAKRPAEKASSRRDPARAEAFEVAMRNALRGFDARVRLVAERLTASGTGQGRFEAAATLDAGLLRIAPVKLTAQRGVLEVNIEADLAADPPRYRLQTTLDEFRYGKLLKSIAPKTDDDGSLSLKLHLAGRGKLHEIAPTLEGEVDFAAFPRGLNAAALNLLGGGILSTLVPVMDSARDSSLNCAVATFDVGKGRAKSTALMVDSTRVRAAGQLELDLASGAMKGIIAPKSKRPELFSTQLPIEIAGTVTAPKAGVARGGLATSAARLFFFEYAYLYDAAAGGRLAPDGREDCIAAYKRLANEPANATKTQGK
jgi:uncharacterized protein involved in outer membrane biogenesis